jgi:hypothetical protein
MKKEKLRKILAIRDYNIKKEDEFPKNPDNITKDELHDHFDLDDDGKVTLDEYADHINFHCDNPEILDEELENSEYEKGFKYKKGGKTKKAKTWKEKYNKKYGNELDASNSLSDIAEDTGVSKKGIQQIYNKGIGAYKTNPSSVRPNVKSKEQWAQARVYSAVMGGKASKVDKKELSMEKGGIMDSRRNKDKEFDRAQEREYMRSQYDRLTQDDKEKLKMIQQMMAKEKVNYAKGGKLRNTEYNLRTFFTFDGEDFAIFGGHLYGAREGDNEFMLIDNINYAPKEVQVAYYEKMRGFEKGGELDDIVRKLNKVRNKLTDIKLKADLYTEKGVEEFRKKTKPLKEEERKLEDKLEEIGGEEYILPFAKGGEVKKSEKYGSEYKKEDGQLLFRPINTKEDWSEVSDEAFNKEERKDFDKEMERLFGKKVDFGRGGDIEEVYLVQVEWKQLKDKGLGKFILTESDVERLEDDYGSTFYFEIYDDSDEKPISFTKMKNILDKAMAEKGLTESYFEKGGKTIDFKLDYLYNQLKISKNILDNSINNADKTINLIRYEAIQKAIDNILIKP